MIARQVGGDLVPAVRGLRTAMEQEDRREARGAPVEEVKAEPVQGGRAVAGGGHERMA